MVKMWRDVAHGCASELHTTSESIEIDDVMDENGDPMKFVRVYKLSKKEEEEKKQLEISLREKAEKAKKVLPFDCAEPWRRRWPTAATTTEVRGAGMSRRQPLLLVWAQAGGRP